MRWDLLQVGGEYRSYCTFLHPYSVSARVCSNSPNFPNVESYISTLTAFSTYPNCSNTALILSHFPHSQVHFEELSLWRNPRWSPSHTSIRHSLYNLLVYRGHYPMVWKGAMGQMILKPNKKKSVPGSFQPISLLCNLGKVLESIVTTRLYSWAESTKLLPPEKSRFRKKRLVNDRLFQLTQIVVQQFARCRTQHVGIVHRGGGGGGGSEPPPKKMDPHLKDQPPPRISQAESHDHLESHLKNTFF